MKKLFSIIAVAIMMFIGSTNNAMAQHKNNVADVLTSIANALVNASSNCGTYNPNTGMTRFVGDNCTCYSNSPQCHVTRVEKCVDQTVVHIVYVPGQDVAAYIPADTSIKDNAGNLTFPLRASSGLYTDHSVNLAAGQPYEFTLVFPSVTIKCQSIDIVEHYQGFDRIYHVEGLATGYCN